VRAKEANDRSKEKSDESKHGKEIYQNSWRSRRIEGETALNAESTADEP
jgi:hypothetical protein